jgi:DNA-binding transcriptional regulator of glucitol operon
MRRLLTPGWVLLHLFAIGVVGGCLAAGRWQWQRGVELERFQNYAYGIEWCIFGAFAVFMWVKTIRDAFDPELRTEEQPVAPPAPPPVAQVADEDDPELAAYNAHLAWLNANPRQ